MNTELSLKDLRAMMARLEAKQEGIRRRWKRIVERIEEIEDTARKIRDGDSRVRAAKPRGARARREEHKETEPEPRPGMKRKPRKTPARAGRRKSGDLVAAGPLPPDPQVAKERETVEAAETPEPAHTPESDEAPFAEEVLDAVEHHDEAEEPVPPHPSPELQDLLTDILENAGKPLQFEDLVTAVKKAGFDGKNGEELIQASVLSGPFRETVNGITIQPPKAPSKPLADLLQG